MKILHLSANGFTVKNLLIPQIDYFLDQGFLVEIGCSSGAETQNLQRQGYIIRSIEVYRDFHPIFNAIDVLQLARLMRKHRYDLIHVHTPVAAFVGRIAARLAGIKRVVYTAHRFPFHDYSPGYLYYLYFMLEKLAAPLTDLILTQSYEDFLTAQTRHLCPIQKVRHLGNGIDIDRFSRTALSQQYQAKLRHLLGIPKSADMLIGTIGRLTYKKGSSFFIEAIAQLLPKFPNLHAIIIGGEVKGDPSPYQAQLVKQIHKLGLEKHVTLTGYRDDTPELLGLLNIFTLPTFTHEGLPRSILEAMGMELPVVTTDVRGCREAVVHGKTGLIIPPRDSNALALALEKLLADQELRKTFGKAGRQRVETEFDETLVFQKLQGFYQELGIVPMQQHLKSFPPKAIHSQSHK